jgi:RecB family exonuclease
VGLRPVILIAPSPAAAVELPRRLAGGGRPLAGCYAFKLEHFARAVAEPLLLGRGMAAWGPGHDALLATRLLAEAEGEAGVGGLFPADLPRAPLARVLARTLSELRRHGVDPDRLRRVAERPGTAPEDARRLLAVAMLHERFGARVEGRLADPVQVYRAAAENLPRAIWLQGAEVLLAGEAEWDPAEREFLAAVARTFPTRRVATPRPAGLEAASWGPWAEAHGLRAARGEETLLGPIAPPAPPPGLERLCARLFEAPVGTAVRDDSVELLTAPGEAAEAGAIARRLLREARRGVPFEDMAVLLPRPEAYAPLLLDLLDRLGIPCRLHPSRPLRFGRAARSLLLLLRGRGLERGAVLEFLTFAPVPFERMLPPEVPAEPSRWDGLSRDAGIVSGHDRWIVGLRAHAEAERAGAKEEASEERARARLARAAEAEALLEVVGLLSATLDRLAGEASWPEWARILVDVLDQWVGPEKDREAVADVLAELGGLGSVAARAAWADVESVIEARLEWEREPLRPQPAGAVHVGALDALAGLPFRFVAIPGLVEGGYPGVFRPDPFLLDVEREALAGREAAPPPPRSGARGQLSLFDEEPPAAPRATPPEPAPRLPTSQDRLLQARREFHRAISQATERLVLSYPRADARHGRERLPSLFFVAAASCLAGRPVSGSRLEVVEDELDSLDLGDTLGPSERDRARLRRGGRAAAEAVAGGSPFFRQARRALAARWSDRLTPYDGFVGASGPEAEDAEALTALRRRLDPTAGADAVSASRLAVFAQCGFLYFLQYVLRLEPTLVPEERRRLEPLERGDLFHRVAERFLRELRDAGQLPVADTPENRRRLLDLAREALDGLVAASPPRFVVSWERERSLFCDLLLGWLEREADRAERSTPLHFEVGFGLRRPETSAEPHSRTPLVVDLGDGRTLRVQGKIDRIDRRPDGALVLRDYKTGRAPRDDGGTFRGGRQLQVPFYVLACQELLRPGERVVEAFLDYVDAGRLVGFDPARVTGPEFRRLLAQLADLLAGGVFAQDPSFCDLCDFTEVCGPKALIEVRRRYKGRDRLLHDLARLKGFS